MLPWRRTLSVAGLQRRPRSNRFPQRQSPLQRVPDEESRRRASYQLLCFRTQATYLSIQA